MNEKLAFCQASHENAADSSLAPLRPIASPTKIAKTSLSHRELSKKEVLQDDSDSFDFNEIDHEIQDTLHRSESNSENCGASQLTQESQSEERSQNSLNNSMVELTAINSGTGLHQQHAETISTTDSVHDSDSSSGLFSEAVLTPWCVIVPSEAVLFFDNLDNYFATFGKVLAVNDVNESIQVQYQDKNSAQRL